MAVSEIELKYIVKSVKDLIDDVYYVSNIYPVTKDSIVIRFHHSQKSDISLLISIFGICITKYKYSVIEENDSLKKIKSELERSRLIDISVFSGERIVQLIFQTLKGNKYSLIVEFFGNGNIILCNDDLKILTLINPINVRHRILKPGLNYFPPPPPKGKDLLSLDFEDFIKLRELNNNRENLEIKKWLGRNLSISKKFIDFAVNHLKFDNKRINDLTQIELRRIFDELVNLVKGVYDGSNHNPCIIFDTSSNLPTDVSPVIPPNALPESIKKFESYSEALDEFLNYVIKGNISNQNSEIDRQIQSLEHDLHEQEKAKDLVISKSNKLRSFAGLLMQQMSGIFDVKNPSFQKIVDDYDAQILTIKGKEYLELVGERIPLDIKNVNVPKISSLLFNVAKEMERGLITIETSHKKLLEQLEKIKQKKDKKPVSEIKVIANKEWYEKYRWFFTSNDLLAIGGRDSSSNSVIIRKHLTENDIVFHAEIHGSPFFILKNANNASNSIEDISNSINEVAQATVSFSRSWKEALSASDAYWILPSQVKKGAPTGQYLPKGSFIIEGKRNFIKNLEIKLAIGLSFNDERPLVIVGPYSAIRKRSICLRSFLPSGLDVIKASKKIKADFVDYSIKNQFSKKSIELLKLMSIDEIVRVLPVGQFKLLTMEKGDLHINLDMIIEK